MSRASLAAGAVPVLWTFPAAGLARDFSAAPVAPAMPVVSLHLDQPYLDKSGTATPYVPPAGARSAQAASELSDVEFLSRFGYF